MNTRSPGRPATIYVLLALLLFLGVSGLVGGIGMLADPSGESMALELAWLDSVPVDDFLFPGLILVTVFGVAPLFTAYGVIARPRWSTLQRLTPWKDNHWSWGWSRLIGGALVLWIGLELLMGLPITVLQPLYMGIGLALLIMTGYGSVRGYLSLASRDTQEAASAGTKGQTE